MFALQPHLPRQWSELRGWELFDLLGNVGLTQRPSVRHIQVHAAGHVGVVWELAPDKHMLAVLDAVPQPAECFHPIVQRLQRACGQVPLQDVGGGADPMVLAVLPCPALQLQLVQGLHGTLCLVLLQNNCLLVWSSLQTPFSPQWQLLCEVDLGPLLPPDLPMEITGFLHHPGSGLLAIATTSDHAGERELLAYCAPLDVQHEPPSGGQLTAPQPRVSIGSTADLVCSAAAESGRLQLHALASGVCISTPPCCTPAAWTVGSSVAGQAAALPSCALPSACTSMLAACSSGDSSELLVLIQDAHADAPFIVHGMQRALSRTGHPTPQPSEGSLCPLAWSGRKPVQGWQPQWGEVHSMHATESTAAVHCSAGIVFLDIATAACLSTAATPVPAESLVWSLQGKGDAFSWSPTGPWTREAPLPEASDVDFALLDGAPHDILPAYTGYSLRGMADMTVGECKSEVGIGKDAGSGFGVCGVAGFQIIDAPNMLLYVASVAVSAKRQWEGGVQQALRGHLAALASIRQLRASSGGFSPSRVRWLARMCLAHAAAACMLLEGLTGQTSFPLPSMVPAASPQGGAPAPLVLGSPRSPHWQAFSAAWAPRLGGTVGMLPSLGAVAHSSLHRVHSAQAWALLPLLDSEVARRGCEDVCVAAVHAFLLRDVAHPVLLAQVAGVPPCPERAGITQALQTALQVHESNPPPQPRAAAASPREARRGSVVSDTLRSLQDVFAADFQDAAAKPRGKNAKGVFAVAPFGAGTVLSADDPDAAPAYLAAIADQEHAVLGEACHRLRAVAAKLEAAAPATHAALQRHVAALVDLQSAAQLPHAMQVVRSLRAEATAVALFLPGDGVRASSGSLPTVPAFPLPPHRRSSTSAIDMDTPEAATTELAVPHSVGLPTAEAISEALTAARPETLAQLLLGQSISPELDEGALRASLQEDMIRTLEEQLGISACRSHEGQAADMLDILHPDLFKPSSDIVNSVLPALVQLYFHRHPKRILWLLSTLLAAAAHCDVKTGATALPPLPAPPAPVDTLQWLAGAPGTCQHASLVGSVLDFVPDRPPPLPHSILAGMPASAVHPAPPQHTAHSTSDSDHLSDTQLWQTLARGRVLFAAGFLRQSVLVLCEAGQFTAALGMLRQALRGASLGATSNITTMPGRILALSCRWTAPGHPPRAPVEGASEAVPETAAAGEGIPEAPSESRAAATAASAPPGQGKFAQMMQDAREATRARGGGGAASEESSDSRSARSRGRSRGTSASFSAEQEVWGRETALLDAALASLLGEPDPTPDAPVQVSLPTAVSKHAADCAGMLAAAAAAMSSGNAGAAGGFRHLFTVTLEWALRARAGGLLCSVLHLLHVHMPFTELADMAERLLGDALEPVMSAIQAPHEYLRTDEAWAEHMSALQGEVESACDGSGVPPSILKHMACALRVSWAVSKAAGDLRMDAKSAAAAQSHAPANLLRGFA